MLRRSSKSLTPEASLLLFIYDSRRGNTESTEKEKILAFFPSAVNIDEQLSTVGLAQTFSLFSGTFSGDSNFITLDTDKRKWAVRNFEPGVWVGMVVGNNWGPGKAGSGGCKIFLEDLYGYLVLLHGSVQRLLDLDATGRRARASLQGIVEIWGDMLVQKRSAERKKFENPLSLGRLGAVPTLTLGRSAFLSLQTLVQALHQIDVGASVRRVMICFDAFLLWSDLNGKNTRQLYGFVEKSEMLSEGKGLERGAALIHIMEEDELTPFWLMPLYKLPLSIFLILDANPQTPLAFNTLNEEIRKDATSLLQAATAMTSTTKDYHIAGYRYVHVDRLMHVGYATPDKKVKTLNDKTLQILTRIQNKIDEHCLAAEDGGDFETVVKGEAGGGWVMTKKAGSKTLYVALDILDDFTLEEVDEYVSRMCHKHFPGAFEL